MQKHKIFSFIFRRIYEYKSIYKSISKCYEPKEIRLYIKIYIFYYIIISFYTRYIYVINTEHKKK